MKKLSIITINYNNKNGLEKTIKSVINQTFDNFEYIIIDGGSTDGSIDVINKYKEHIDYHVSEHDNGIYNAMNKGIEQAHGEYLNFMNSGDTLHSITTLSEIVNLLKEDIIIGQCITGNNIFSLKFNNENLTFIDLIVDSINHQSSFIKKSLFINKKYNENYKIISDWIFFIEKLIFDNCSVKNVNIIVADYEYNGLSSNRQAVLTERRQYLKSILSPRIYMDYMKLIQCKKSTLYDIIPKLEKTKYTYQLFVMHINDLLIKIYHFIISLIHYKN